MHKWTRVGGGRLFFRVGGVHVIARLRSLVVPPQPPKPLSFRVQGSYPPKPLQPFFFGSSYVHSSPVQSPSPRRSQHFQPGRGDLDFDFLNYKKTGLQQRIPVAEALVGLHTWISVGGFNPLVHKDPILQEAPSKHLKARFPE